MMSKTLFPRYTPVATVAVTMLMFVLTTCDVKQDRQKCENQLLGLATCLSYVSDQSNVPPPDCCTGFNQVDEKSPECICLLIKDRNDPSVSIKINATRALGLPALCKSHNKRTVADCPALLHLPPNSPDAKVFEDFANTAKKSNATTPSPAGAGNSSTAKSGVTESSNPKSDGGRRKTSSASIVMFLALATLYFFSI